MTVIVLWLMALLVNTAPVCPTATKEGPVSGCSESPIIEELADGKVNHRNDSYDNNKLTALESALN